MVKSKKSILILILSAIFAFALISFVAARPVSADTSVITMKETASVRLDPDGRNGIRFTGYVSESVELDEDTFAGIIVARANVEAPTINDDVIDVKAERFDPAKDTVLGRAFNAVIYDIITDRVNASAQDLTARAYVCDNGEYTYSDNVCIRSLAQVASKVIIADDPNVEDLKVLKGYVDAANPVLKIGDVVLSDTEETEIALKITESATISVEPANLAISVYVEKESTGLEVNGNVIKAVGSDGTEQLVIVDLGSKSYLINVSIEKWVDENIKSNLLADFDEEQYLTLLTKTAGNYEITHLDAEAATAELGEPSDGVIKLVSKSGWSSVKIPFNKIYNKNKDVGFYVKLRHNIAEAGNLFFQIRDAENNVIKSDKVTTWSMMNYVHTTNKMTIINFTYDDMFCGWSYGAWKGVTVDEFDNICIYSINAGDVIYVEEVGCGTIEPENTFIDFNQKDDKANTYVRWGTAWDVLLPGEEGYPTDKGATDGVLKITANGSNNLFVFPGANVDGSTLSKIIVRVYVPNENTEDHVALCLGVNAQKGVYTSANHDSWDYSCIYPGGNQNHFFNRGAFVDVEFDVAGKLAAGPVHTLCVKRPWYGAAGESWYVDSIRFVKA